MPGPSRRPSARRCQTWRRRTIPARCNAGATPTSARIVGSCRRLIASSGASPTSVPPAWNGWRAGPDPDREGVCRSRVNATSSARRGGGSP
eukprot:6274864-Prymnesium_polylepis.1